MNIKEQIEAITASDQVYVGKGITTADIKDTLEKLYTLILESPEPETIDPETMQPQMRSELYRNPEPQDRTYAEWRKRAIVEVKDG